MLDLDYLNIIVVYWMCAHLRTWDSISASLLASMALKRGTPILLLSRPSLRPAVQMWGGWGRPQTSINNAAILSVKNTRYALLFDPGNQAGNQVVSGKQTLPCSFKSIVHWDFHLRSLFWRETSRWDSVLIHL